MVFRRYFAVDLLFDRVERSFQQPGQRCQLDQQGLLPATDRANGDGGGSAR